MNVIFIIENFWHFNLRILQKNYIQFVSIFRKKSKFIILLKLTIEKGTKNLKFTVYIPVYIYILYIYI